jgi:hypothetical protein
MKIPIGNKNETEFWSKCSQRFFNFYPWETKDLPEVVYHYTSLSALPEVLRNQAIWASSFRYLNDMKEGRYLVEKSVEFIKGHNKLTPEFNPENLPPKYTSEIYVSCFTTKQDDLNQWRAYADDGRGVAIGFDRKKLAEIAKGIPFDFTGFNHIIFPRFDFYKVSYDIEERISRFLDVCINAQALAGDADTPYKKKMLKLWHKALTILLSSTTKSEQFSSEEEWRIIGMYENLSFDIDSVHEFEFIDDIQTRGHHDIKFRSSNNRIIPYYNLPFDKSAIKEIVLGPKNRYQTEALSDAIKLNLQAFKYKQPKIIPSRIDYI